jgi:hypothetical protein
MSDGAYTLPEGFPQPTVFQSLLNVATKDPISEWNFAVSQRAAKILDDLENTGIEFIRKAYAAGVADGYRQALIELEKADS